MTAPTLPESPGWMGDPKRGAALGRPGWSMRDAPKGKLYLRELHLNGGGYDSGGAYWGLGQRLYWASDGAAFDLYVRAADRDDAKAAVRYEYPPAEFYR